MTIEDVKFLIKNHLSSSISQRDLSTLCNIFSIPITARRKQNQQNLIDSILVTTDLTLLHHILYMLNKTNGRPEINPPVTPQMRSDVQNFAQNSTRFAPSTVPSVVNFSPNDHTYSISNELIDRCPIDIRKELVPGVDPLNIFVSNFTKYPNGYFNAPSSAASLINGRINLPNSQLPYISKNTIIKPSPFYCCQVVLHPLCLLIPKPTPNICQPNRTMAKMQLNFILSNSAKELINAHRCQIDNKRIYKWQVLLRFGVYDPLKPFPTSTDSYSNLVEYIPPYLSIIVNDVSVPLWDILPSNNTTKEGKRHSRPINISDYMKYSLTDGHGYRQYINLNWWQTPGVFLYYYAAVFLERKLAVTELLSQFVNKTHSVQRSITVTLDFIRDKFSTNSQLCKRIDGDDNDDNDMIMSSVLPVSLQCPVGKSRINCPLRSINCQHLQCFDAQLYLMMNERRSVWKCPVCDGSATFDELFVDEYFQQILNDFHHDDEITEVNVNPDGTYIPVAVKESREGKQHVGNIISNVENIIKNNENQTETSSGSSTENGNNCDNLNSHKDQIQQPNITSNEIHSGISSAKERKSVSPNNKLHFSASDCAIDLTSDSEDDIKTRKDTPNINTKIVSHAPSIVLHPSASLQSSPKLLPKLLSNKTETANFPSSLMNGNFSLATNPFQRLPNNGRLLLPANKNQALINPSMMWLQNQNYPCIYPKETIMPQSFFPNRNFSLPNGQQHMLPSVGQGYSNMNVRSPVDFSSLIPRPIKLDPYNNIQSNEPQSFNSSPIAISPKKNTPTKRTRISSTESQASRRSSRIEGQDKKKYNESSDSDDQNVATMVNKVKKRKSDISCDDSGTLKSSSANKKNKRNMTFDESTICPVLLISPPKNTKRSKPRLSIPRCPHFTGYCNSAVHSSVEICTRVMQAYYRVKVNNNIGYVCPTCKTLQMDTFTNFCQAHGSHLKHFSGFKKKSVVDKYDWQIPTEFSLIVTDDNEVNKS